MNIDEIKELLKSGDVAGAEAAAQKLLESEPDNVQAMMLYGTCRQLQGDEATFRDAYRTVKEHLDDKPDALDAETKAAWARFDELYAKLDQPELRRRGSAPRKSAMLEYAIVAAVIVAALVTGIWLFGEQILGLYQLPTCCPIGGLGDGVETRIDLRERSGYNVNADCCAAVRPEKEDAKFGDARVED